MLSDNFMSSSYNMLSDNMLLRAGGDFEKIVLSPFLRYLKSCCKDKSHLTNRKDPEYFGKLGEAIRNMRESIKDTVYGKKIRNFKVLDPTALLEADDDDDVATAVKLKSYLRDDPVHLNSDGYADIVQGLLDQILDGEFTRKSRGGHSSLSGTGTARGTKNRIQSRREWVDKDDAIAQRSDIKNWRGRGHGKTARGHRGGYRGGNRGGSRGGGFGGGNRGSYKNRFKPY
jgi:hypothetical protein